MIKCLRSFLAIAMLFLLFNGCAPPKKEELAKPMLLIKIRDDSGKVVRGVSVKLYKTTIDSAATQVVDSNGVVLFTGLDPALYFWLVERGCQTNRVSQVSLNRPLVPGATHYGYSVLTETGTLKVINNSAEAYKVSDSLFTATVKKDTPLIIHRRVRTYKLHSELLSTPGVGKDSIIRIRCSDTTVINIPF